MEVMNGYCKCGGYLGSGGVDGYAGRWCNCANPVLADLTTIVSGDTITLYDGFVPSVAEVLKAENEQLKQHINHIRKVHDYQDQQGNEVTLQLRVAIVNASEFSRRG